MSSGRRKIKKSVKIFLGFMIFFVILFVGLYFFINYYVYNLNTINVDKIIYKDNILSIKLDVDNKHIKYLECSIVTKDKKKKYKKLHNNVCSSTIEEGNNYELFIKYRGKNIKVNYESKILDYKFDNAKYYLAVGESIDLNYSITSLGQINTNLIPDKDKIISVDKNKITALKQGKTILYFEDIKNKYIDIVVTDLFVKAPKEYNYNKPLIRCGIYSNNENKILDEALENRVKNKGYQTRAGVVEAARFITLNFPYAIPYFSENGRLTVNGVDGEGRFYHSGLYLSPSKYKVINNSDKGPAAWGCTMYSKPSKGNRANGFDCSGFTTWAVYNGGFDIGDWGAKGKSSNELNNFGEEVFLNSNNTTLNKIKAGDLLGEVSVSEGHSAMIIGIDKNYYYVAESLWISPLGLNVNKYKKTELYKYFETVNLMDSYYKKDGYYTNMWY